jgi:hypothetical protein
MAARLEKTTASGGGGRLTDGKADRGRPFGTFVPSAGAPADGEERTLNATGYSELRKFTSSCVSRLSA